jgi:NTE family protein
MRTCARRQREEAPGGFDLHRCCGLGPSCGRTARVEGSFALGVGSATDGTAAGIVTGDTPLSSPAIGTSTTDLIESCAVREPRHGEPPAPPGQPPFALAFSGGGFRASLAALGVLRFLADAGLLAQVRWVSSVSGGSVAHGLFAHAYPHLESEGFTPEALENSAIRPLVQRISGASMAEALLRRAWRIVGPRTRTDLLADTFDAWFFGGRLLEDLSPNCRFIFNAADLTTGVRFGFERDVFGDYVLGQRITAGSGLRLADAVAASAAFPGAFPPVVLRRFDFPCSNRRTAKLLDGGAYDNMGLEPLDDLNRRNRPEHLRDACLVALNAGGVFRTGRYGRIPLVRDLQRANSLLYRQSVVLRARTMVERFQAWEQSPSEEKPPWARRGVLFGLATTMKEGHAAEWRERRPEPSKDFIADLARTETSFNRFSPELCERLLYRGWWLAGATLSQYHPDVLPDEWPFRPDPDA